MRERGEKKGREERNLREKIPTESQKWVNS